MSHFTLDELSEIARLEEQFVNELIKQDPMIESQHCLLAPKEDSVQRIIAYNQALSVRPSKKLNVIKLVLN